MFSVFGLYLLCAIFFEVAGTTCLKLSDGFTRLWPSIGVGIFYTISFGLLSLALKRIEVGVAYAVWAGLGTALIAVIGVIFFREIVSVQKIVAIGLIITGVVMLNLTGGTH